MAVEEAYNLVAVKLLSPKSIVPRTKIVDGLFTFELRVMTQPEARLKMDTPDPGSTMPGHVPVQVRV